MNQPVDIYFYKAVTDREAEGSSNGKEPEKDSNKEKDDSEEESDDDIDAAMDKEKEQILQVFILYCITIC